MKYTVLELQRQLLLRGYNPGPLDGILGSKTESAIIAFKKSRGLRPRAFVGPVTENLLFNAGVKNVPTDKGKIPPWMVIARSLEGTREIAGRKHNPNILALWKMAKLPFTDDETPWCAGFVGACLEQAGFRSTRSAAARSYERWEYGTRLRKPVAGCIVVFWRGKPTGWSGHVGFVDSVDQQGRLIVLGGNQGNAVNIKPFNKARVVGYFWPKAYPLPDGSGLRRIISNAASSTNEA